MRNFLPVFGSVLVWAIAPILITIVGRAGFDPCTQTFYRYATAAAFFLVVAAASDRPGLAAAFRAWRRTGVMALVVVAFQLTWVKGIYLTTPTVAVFAEHSAIVFGLAGGALFFADERAVVLSWRFLAGAAVVAAGAGGVILGGTAEIEGGPVSEGGPALGATCLVAAAAAWGAYSLLIKRAVVNRAAGAARSVGTARCPDDAARGAGGESRGGNGARNLLCEAPEGPFRQRVPGTLSPLRPIPAFAVTMAEASVLVLAVTAIFGDPGGLGRIAGVSGWIVLALLVSGAACVGFGQALYFVSIGRIGVAMSQTVTLMTPFLTGLFSFALLGERMGAFQWACGAVLVAGVVYLIKVRVPGCYSAK